MPGGPALHSGLKASFLNFPMLLKTLSQDGFSGYVSIVGEGTSRSAGHILFRDGDVLQAQHRADGNYRRGKTAMQEVIRTVGLGQGLIDAVEVPAELVASVSALIVASTAFVNLPARIVDFDALLEYVEEQRLSGGVLVGHGDQVAVALLTEGTIKGSYSSTAPDLTEGPQVASAACSEREARIDVVSGPSQAMTPIDLADRPRQGRGPVGVPSNHDPGAPGGGGDCGGGRERLRAATNPSDHGGLACAQPGCRPYQHPNRDHFQRTYEPGLRGEPPGHAQPQGQTPSRLRHRPGG